MTSSLNYGSAKIYQFPIGGRAALGRRFADSPSTHPGTPRVNETICSGSWYHEEAIQDAKRDPGKRDSKPGWDR